MATFGSSRKSSSSSSKSTAYPSTSSYSSPSSRSYSPSSKSEERPTAASKEFLILIALIFHLFDAFILGFEINPNTIVARAIMYTILAIMTHMMIKEHGPVGAIKEYGLWASISVIFIPLFYYLIGLIDINPDFAHNVSAVILAIPMYIIYLMYFKGFNHEFYKGWEIFRNILSPISWAKAWFIVLTFLMIFSAITMFSDFSEIVGTTPKINAEEGARVIGATFSNTYTKMKTSLGSVIPIFKRRYDELWNSTMGTKYNGQVEQNKYDVGVSISNFELSGQKFYEGTPIIFFPTVNVKSFGEDRLNLVYNCTAYNSRNKTHPVIGTVTPPYSTVERYDDVGVRCEFNTNEQNRLKEGNYKIEFTARFSFETWAYTTYVFMERNFANSIRAAGSDLNVKFNIPRRPKLAIYTSGPVELGMSQNINLPITLDYQRGASFPLGMSLANRDTSAGEIVNVKEFRLLVPSPVLINPEVGCTQKMSGSSRDPDTGYNIYSFRVPVNAPKQSYLTIDCSMTMTGLGVNNLLSDPNGVTGATIMGQTEYDYVLKEKLYSVKINKDPYYNNQNVVPIS